LLNAHSQTENISYLDTYLLKIKVPRRDILDFLFYRNSRRMDRKNIECPRHHAHCMYVFFSTVVPGFVPIRRCIRDFKDKDDLIMSVYAEIVGSYYLDQKNLHRRKAMHYASMIKFYYDAYTSRSQIKIKKMTNHTNPPREKNVIRPPFMRPIIRALFKNYMLKAFNIDIDKIAAGTLAAAALHVMSWEDMIYETFHGLQRVINTGNDLNYSSIIRLYTEFSKDGAQRGEPYGKIQKLMTDAKRILYVFLGADKHVGTIDFRYDPLELMKKLKLMTSGGIFPAKTGVGEIGGTKIAIKREGIKILHFEAQFRHFHRMVIRMIKGLPYDMQPICKTAPKIHDVYLGDLHIDDLQKKTR